MKINLSKLCLRLSSVFAVLAIFSTLLVPAHAEQIDYEDYIDHVEVDGDNDICYVYPDIKLCYFEIHEMGSDGNWRVAKTGKGTVYYDFKLETEYRIRYFPFGTFPSQSGLLLHNIPEGSVIESGFGFDVDKFTVTSTPSFSTFYSFRKGDDTIHQMAYYLGKSAVWNDIRHTFVLPLIPDADYLNVELSATEFYFQGSAPTMVTASDTKLILTISSLYRLQQLTGKNNAILEKVQLELAEQGKTLDDIRDQNDQIINGTVTPDSPDGGDRFDDLGDAEAGLRDDAQDGLDTGIEITQNALEIIMQYATAFACAGWIFECFSTLPLFTALLFVSMALGIFGLVVNLANDVGRAYRWKNSKSKRSGKKGG